LDVGSPAPSALSQGNVAGISSRSLLWIAVASCAYFAAARIGTALHLPSNHIAIAWPASGVALAAFHLIERRRWWLLALGVGLANLVANWAVKAQIGAAGLATIADLLEAAGGAALLARFARRRVDMTRLRDVVGLSMIALIVAPVCAVLGTALAPAGGAAPFFERWRQWAIVDGVGIIFVAPVILGAAGWLARKHRPSTRARMGFALVVVATAATTWLTISADVSAPGSTLTSRYLVFPWLVLSALRSGPAGAAITASVMSSVAIATAIASTSLLAPETATNVVLALQLFISIATFTTLGIASLDAQRQRASRALLRANRALQARSAELEREVRGHRESEARVAGLKDDLADVIDSMPLALITVDQQDVINHWNRRAEAVVGVGVGEAWGRPAREVLADFWPAIEASRSRQHAPGNSGIERLHVERGGSRRSYGVTFYPLARGYVQGGVVMIGDITEQERLQEVIVQTEKMISLGGLAAGMAHEINNPLGIIAQAAQNVQRRTSADLPANRDAAAAAGLSLDSLQRYLEVRGVQQFIRDIRDAAARAAVIVSNMLEFSRRSPSAKVPVKLADVLDRALALAASDFDLRKQYDFRRIQIVREYAAALPPVVGVVIELEQVFLNLIKNAAQALAGGGQSAPRIRLCTSQEDRYALVTVEDNGPGMDEATRRRVFEPFFTTKQPGVGTGLGLSVSFAIITGNHKGTIAVNSSHGAGATFMIRLPLAPEEMA
jgi:PAS domain S-box-containing protein